MAMEAVWMTRAMHMNGSILPIMATTSGLFVKSVGAKITTHPAQMCHPVKEDDDLRCTGG